MLVLSIIIAIKVHAPQHALLYIAIAVGIIIYIRWGVRYMVKKHANSQLSWRVTDGGLERNNGAFKPETIRWNQIEIMRWVPWKGLIVLWREPMAEYNARSEWFTQYKTGDAEREFGQIRTVLLVRKEAATALLTIASSKTSLTPKQLRDGPGILKTWQKT